MDNAMGGRLWSVQISRKMMAWLHAQAWINRAYRKLPLGWRQALGVTLAKRLSARTHFTRTAAWAHRLPAAKTLAMPAARDIPGVNILGYLSGQFGLAESARLYAGALISQGTPVALFDIELALPHSQNDRTFERYLTRDLPYPVSIIFVNPDYFERALEHIGRERLKGHHLIACWFWELPQIPSSWKPALAQVDEILVASRFIEDAVRLATDKPVLRVPLPLPETFIDSGLQRSDFGLEEDHFVFLLTFDFNSWIARKNPYAALRAFQLAFGDGRDDVRLVVKTTNGHRHPSLLQALLDATTADARIIVRDQVLDRGHVAALQRCCDAYVSLHRAEGFGLGLAECMAMGKPVIATAWSGNLEFMDPDNSMLVDYRLTEVRDGEYPHEPGDMWAEADVHNAAAAMRKLQQDSAFALELGRRAEQSVKASLAPKSAALTINARLNELDALRRRSLSQEGRSCHP